MYFKVHCNGHMCPAKFQVQYRATKANKGRKIDLKVYLSLNTKEPNESHGYTKYVPNVTLFIFYLYSLKNLFSAHRARRDSLRNSFTLASIL